MKYTGVLIMVSPPLVLALIYGIAFVRHKLWCKKHIQNEATARSAIKKEEL